MQEARGIVEGSAVGSSVSTMSIRMRVNITSCPATLPLFLRVKLTVMTFSCKLSPKYSATAQYQPYHRATHSGSKDAPYPDLTLPPAADPLTSSPLYTNVVYDIPKPNSKRGAIPAYTYKYTDKHYQQ